MHVMWSLKPVILREQWGAYLPIKRAPYMIHTIKAVAFVYTETEECHTKEECRAALKKIQLYHMDNGMYDIPYSFILGGDRKVYEGRGWNFSVPVPFELEESPYSTLVIARIGPIPTSFTRKLADFKKGYNMIHLGTLKGFIHPSFEFIKVFEDWNTRKLFPCYEMRNFIVKEKYNTPKNYTLGEFDTY